MKPDLTHDQLEHFGYAYYFNRFQDYTDGILKGRTEVILFEYLLSMGEHFLKKGNYRFWHSYATIRERTGIAPKTAREIVAKLEEEGLLTTEVEYFNRSRITFFTIRYAAIAGKSKALWGNIAANNLVDNKKLAAQVRQFDRLKQRKRALRRMVKSFVKLKNGRMM